MKINLRFLLFVLLIAGCKKNSGDKDPVLKACFSVSRNDVGPAEEVSFNSGCSVLAYAYEWDFGDNNTSAQVNPRHAYKFKGTYPVRLRVRNKERTVTSEYTHNIVVGDRYFSGLTVRHLAFKDSSGLNWHYNNTGPDIFMMVQRKGAKDTLYRTDVKVKTRSLDLPILWRNAGSNVLLTKEVWVFSMVDAFVGDSPRLMASWELDMRTNTDIPYRILTPDYDIDILFEIK